MAHVEGHATPESGTTASGHDEAAQLASPAATPSGFTLFPALPAELRLTILEKAVEEPRFLINCRSHEICAIVKRDLHKLMDPSLVSCVHDRSVPPLLHASRDARQLVAQCRFVGLGPHGLMDVGAGRPDVRDDPFRMFNVAVDYMVLSSREPLDMFPDLPHQLPDVPVLNVALHIDPRHEWRRGRGPAGKCPDAERDRVVRFNAVERHVLEKKRDFVYRHGPGLFEPTVIFAPPDFRCHDEHLGRGPLEYSAEACGLGYLVEAAKRSARLDEQEVGLPSLVEEWPVSPQQLYDEWWSNVAPVAIIADTWTDGSLSADESTDIDESREDSEIRDEQDEETYQVADYEDGDYDDDYDVDDDDWNDWDYPPPWCTEFPRGHDEFLDIELPNSYWSVHIYYYSVDEGESRDYPDDRIM
ncbi:hypothetical protein Micbo1qcDRAFT_206917 [Microdochium bolleyi]|uniref:2EXR domain-containing protein n=1 Tax=Microdochium bolleyi TaxID=196109 RepID=A0A136IV81_9PEZI|nr:hypothetical protein Micbo1qcDRAFT_206917 [Microdochium bolleyi]